MLRRWTLSGVAMLIFLVGCGTDTRRTQVNSTLNLLDTTTTKVKTLKDKIVAATDKMTKDQELVLTEPIKLCDELKSFCTKEVQSHALNIQSSTKTELTEAEKQRYNEEFDSQIRPKIESLRKESLELNAAVKNLEKEAEKVTFKNAPGQKLSVEELRKQAMESIDTLKKKLSAATAEFESLNRKS